MIKTLALLGPSQTPQKVASRYPQAYVNLYPPSEMPMKTEEPKDQTSALRQVTLGLMNQKHQELSPQPSPKHPKIKTLGPNSIHPKPPAQENDRIKEMGLSLVTPK